MGSKAGFQEVDAKSHEALTRFFTRTDGWQQVDLNMPFDDLLRSDVAEEEGLEPAGEYEFKQRRIGASLLFQFLLGKGVTPMDVYRQVTAAGRAMHEAPFNAMTMHEIAMMEGQSPAAHSWRCNLMSGKIEQAGMKGSKLPGQKSKAAKASYKVCRRGNQNRLGGAKLEDRNSKIGDRKQRQGSFLRALKVPRHPASSPNGTATTPGQGGAETEFHNPTHEQI